MQEWREDSKNIVPVQAMMGDGRVEIKLHSFLTSTLHRSGSITPLQFYSQEKQPTMYHIRGWVSSGDTLDVFEDKKKSSAPTGSQTCSSSP